MTTSSNQITNSLLMLFNPISWLFGIAVFAAGIINTFWGNDPGFGIFLLLLSFVYFPPVNQVVKILFGFSVPVFLKLFLALFIIMATLGVGELFDKIELMKNSI